MNSNNCRFTIITVCYNAQESIQRTLKSVLSQTFKDYEYWIIDGGSSDNTVEMINACAESFSGRLKLISEPDEGIYDAMNKGVTRAKGQYIVFINADDMMQDNALELVNKVICESPEPYGIYYGDSISAYENAGSEIKKTKKAFPQVSTQTLKCGMGVVHQSMYTSREVFSELGLFNTSYRIGADWDFLIRCVKANVTMKYIPEPLSVFYTSGISAQNHHWERHIIRKDNGLYRGIDTNLLRDCLNIKNILQSIIGPKSFQKVRYSYNSLKQRLKRR